MTDSKQINAYVFPLIATNIVQLLINQVSLHVAVKDSSMVLSSISLLQNALFAFGGILGAFSLSFHIKGAQAFACHENRRFDDLMKSSLLLDVIIGLLFIGMCFVFGKMFIHSFYGFTGEMLAISTRYLRIMSPYILLTLLTFYLTNIIKIEKKTRAIFWIGLASSLLDVALHYLLVPRYGVEGAALAGILSLLAVVGAYLFLVFPLVLKALGQTSTTKMELITFGFPLIVQEILESFLFIMVFDALMGRQPLEILAIYAVVSQLFSFAQMPAFMYAGAVSIFLPESQKEGKEKFLLATLSKSAYQVSGLFALFLLFASNHFAHFLSSDITQNILPFTLYTFFVMAAVPRYELSKMLLQSMEDEIWVVKWSAVVHLVAISCLLVFQQVGFQSYYTLYGVYGLSQLFLALLFEKRRISLQ